MQKYAAKRGSNAGANLTAKYRAKKTEMQDRNTKAPVRKNP
jgi:hypothetical protein